MKKLLALAALFSFVLAPLAQQGVVFPDNTATTSVRFDFTGGNLLPFQPATYIWRVSPIQQTGFYTTMFYEQNNGSFSGVGYGFHPWPPSGSGGTVHNWEVASNASDDTTDENGTGTTVTKGTIASPATYIQAARVYPSGDNDLTMEFYWDLGTNVNRVISSTIDNYRTGPTTSPGLIFGDASWSASNEQCNCILRAIQIYDTVLSVADMQTEAANHTIDAPQTAVGGRHEWYINQNPIPTDISDKSGAGHNPAFVGTARPELWPIPAAVPSIVASGSVKVVQTGSSTTVETGSVTCSGNNRALYVWVGSGASTVHAANAVKWGGSGGTALSQQGSTLTTTNGRFNLWSLVAPAAQSSTVHITYAGAVTERFAVAVCLQDVDQVTPNGTVKTASAVSATPLAWPATATTQLVLDGTFWLTTGCSQLTASERGLNGFTHRQTSIQEVEGAQLNCEGLLVSSEPAMADSTAMAWTISGTPDQGWLQFAFGVNGASAAGTVGGKRLSTLGVGQ